MRHPHIAIIATLSFIIGCSSYPGTDRYVLTNYEQHVCDSLKIDNSVVLQLRKFTNSPIEAFHYSLSKIISNGITKEADPMHLDGIVFTESNKNSDNIVISLCDSLNRLGYSIFTLERNFGFNNNPDYIGILKTTNKYDVLSKIRTDGINWDIDNDSLINIIKTFDKKYSLKLTGASGDWCEFIIQNEPGNWLTLAEEAYKICPDIVEQGTGSVPALADEMKKTKRLYLWWD